MKKETEQQKLNSNKQADEEIEKAIEALKKVNDVIEKLPKKQRKRVVQMITSLYNIHYGLDIKQP